MTGLGKRKGQQVLKTAVPVAPLASQPQSPPNMPPRYLGSPLHVRESTAAVCRTVMHDREAHHIVLLQRSTLSRAAAAGCLPKGP